MHEEEIPSSGYNVLEFFCVPDYLSDLRKKFQVASTYDTKIEYHIWNFCDNLFLNDDFN